AFGAAIFAGLMGSGLAYFLWFGIIGRISAMTASLGVLSAPVIGVVSTALLLGEIPTLSDIVGYVLIFAASVCVLLPARGTPVARIAPQADRTNDPEWRSTFATLKKSLKAKRAQGHRVGRISEDEKYGNDT